MAEPSQRASRSRYSSPFATPQNAGSSRIRGASEAAPAAERPRTFMDKWIEPQLAPARPSFAEAGIERHGVVANMAALGTRPSAKVLKASTRPEPLAVPMEREPTTRSSTRRANQSSGSTPSEAISTPEPPINTIRRRSLSSKAETAEPQPAPPTPRTPKTPKTPLPQNPTQSQEQQQSQSQPPTPHTPQAGTPQAASRQFNPLISGRKPGQSVFALQSPVQPRPSMAYVPPPSQFGPNGEYRVDLDMTDRVVESAVQEALDNQRWPTAYALRTLYDDHRLNPRMVRLIDTIYNGRADENQLKEFKGVMRHKKKEGKKDRTGEYYFNGDGSDPLPGASQFTPAPTRTPSLSGPTSRPAGSASASASPQKESEPASKRQRTSRFSGALSLDLNGDAAGAAGGGHVKSTSPQKTKHQANGTTATRRRSASNTSTSSLSSVDEHLLDDNDDDDEYRRRRTSPAASRSARAEKDPGARQSTRPISGGKETGPKTYAFSSPSRSHHHHHHHQNHQHHQPHHQSQPHHHHRHSHRSRRRSPPPEEPSSPVGDVMAPGALLALAPSSSASNLPQAKGKKATGDPSKPASVPGRAFDENDPAVRMKRKAREITESSVPVLESFERRSRRRRTTATAATTTGRLASETPFSDRERGDSVVAATPPPPPRATASSAPAKRTTLRLLNKKTTRGSQAAAAAAAAAAGYESDNHSSPTLLSFQPDRAPGSASVSASRAGTPSAAGRPVRKPKTGSGLRVKTSPMKKKGGGPLAGIPRQSGERSPTGNGAANNMDDNDDYCCACGGIGDLVCCDGCTRSFHFNCVDPPMKETALPDEWFCKVCAASRHPSYDSERGLFGGLKANLAKKNPISFHLPKDIREYFVDVKTGPEGEYDEGVPPKTRRAANHEDALDYFRLKDSKGNAILCHQCHLSASAPDRSIIPCAYCGLHWHMDCLEVPLAKEPGPGRFRCPAHIDDLLMTLPHTLAPAHRFRKIKGASAIRPAVARGVQNNGHIEIENDPTDDEKELGFYEQREYGHVYKLPEMGIKLDFISQVRLKTGGKGGYAPAPPSQIPTPQPSTTSSTPAVPLDQRTLLEQQAVLNLAALTIPPPELGDPQMLIDALLAEASPAALALIAQADSGNLATNNLEAPRDRNALVALRALIDSRLATFEGSPVLEEAAVEAAEMHEAAAAAEAEAQEHAGDGEGQESEKPEKPEDRDEAAPSGPVPEEARADKDGDTEMSDE